MKAEEQKLIESLLAPLTGLPASLAAALAPLAALPDAVRALARAQDRAHDAQNGAREAPATEQEVLDELAEAGGFELVSENVRGREFEVIANYVRMGREYEAAGGKRGHDVELSEMYAGVREGRGQVWRTAGLDGDPPNDATAIIEALRDQGRDRALEEIDGACAKARVEMRFALCAALGLTPVASYEELLERLDRALEAERSQEHTSARLITEKERAEQRTLELQAELDTRFEEGRAQGRAESAAELDNLQRRAVELVRLLEQAEDKGRARGQWDTLNDLLQRSGHPAVDVSEALDTLAAAVRDGLDAGAFLREVRERAAQGALLALLDERCPGARHERVGLGKVEDLPAVELRAEVARRVGERSTTDAQDERPGLLAALRAFGGRADEGCETWTVDGLRLACANLGQAYRRMEDQCSVQVIKDVYEGLISQRDAYMQQVFDLDRRLRGALDAHEIDHTGADALRCVELLIASREAQAKTLDEAEQAYDAIERDLRTALHNAGVSHVDSDALQCVELLTLVASRNHNARKRLDAANETISAIDAELRRFLTACGETVDGTTLDLARRLADAGQRTVVEVPRSARDGARRELREIVSALGLRVEIDHLSLPEARAAVIAAVQALTQDADTRTTVQRYAHQETLQAVCDHFDVALHHLDSPDVRRSIVRSLHTLTPEGAQQASPSVNVWALGHLCKALAISFDFLVPPPTVEEAIDRTARAIRAHYVNARHEDLIRGRTIVIDAICKHLNVSHDGAEAAIDLWAERVAAEVSARTPGAVGADTTSEQRASVLAAVQVLGGELPSEPTLGEACRELDERIYALTYWAKDNLPLLALWDAQLVENCPLEFKQLDKAGRDMSDAHEDAGDWNPLARDLRAVAEGDDVAALAGWLQPGWDFRRVLDVVLDRVKHLEGECAEADDMVESAKVAIIDRVDDLTRALYERLPWGVHPQLVARAVQDLADVSDPLVNGVRSLLAGAAGRAHEPRTLEDWCTLHPTERNRLIDRTRDALAAVAG